MAGQNRHPGGSVPEGIVESVAHQEAVSTARWRYQRQVDAALRYYASAGEMAWETFADKLVNARREYLAATTEESVEHDEQR